MYLYVRSFKEEITFRKAWPHFIMAAVYAVLAIYLFNTVGARYPKGHDVPPEVLQAPSSIIRVTLRIVQMLTYFFLSLRTLSSYQRSIHQLFSETSRINLEWVRWLINGFLILLFIKIVNYVWMLQAPAHFDLLMLILTAVVTPYIYLATFKGVTQPTLWQLQPGVGKEKIQEEIREVQAIESHKDQDDGSNPKPGLSKEKMDAIVARTVGLMEQEKLYQETELTLQNLADKLQVPSYQVSQAINDGLKKNFYDLVNSYRVEEAKRLLLDPRNRNYKILSVGFDAGFNSKTTFNTVFKKFTGVSPSDFRDRQNAEAVHA
jgi:AraC-like DNA-binding protein